MDPQQQQQPEPTEADYALASMSEDLMNANRLKAAYHGKFLMAEKTQQLLVKENKELRARLESYEQSKADTEAPAQDESPKTSARTKG